MADNTKPKVTEFTVSAKSITLGQDVKITYKVKDSGGSKLARVELWRKDNGGNWREIARDKADGNSESGSFKDRPGVSGSVVYGIHAVDRAGNWGGEGGGKEVKVQAPAKSAPVPGQQPIRPVSGGISFGFNKSAPWASSSHNGIDYSSALGNAVKSVGAGKVHAYTKSTAGRFGSISPDGKADGTGPAIWIQHKLASGEPIYVLYGHCASSYTDKSTGTGASFKFNCIYSVTVGGTVSAGAVIAKTAPFYNGGELSCHLHVSVFKPKKRPDGTYSGPPERGWGYSLIELPEGRFIDPEEFFTRSEYKLATAL